MAGSSNLVEHEQNGVAAVGDVHAVAVVAEGNIVHMRRVARDEFHLGIRFCEFEGNGFDYVDRYVAKLLAGS